MQRPRSGSDRYSRQCSHQNARTRCSETGSRSVISKPARITVGGRLGVVQVEGGVLGGAVERGGERERVAWGEVGGGGVVAEL